MKWTSVIEQWYSIEFLYNVLQNNKIELITQSITLLKMVHTNKYRNDPTFYFVESGKPIPCLCVGNATKSMLQKAPMATGNTVKISRASFEGDGKKQLTTFWSNKTTAAKTKIDITACTKSIGFNLYFAPSSGEIVVDPSMTHMPLKVASP